MKYLIDTQIFLWGVINPQKLSSKTINILQNNEIWISQISFLEISIKQKIGKLPELSISINDLIAQAKSDGFQVLNLSNKHIMSYQDIHLQEKHKDPFDRLILATALEENMPIISADENFKLYVPQIILVEN